MNNLISRGRRGTSSICLSKPLCGLPPVGIFKDNSIGSDNSSQAQGGQQEPAGSNFEDAT